MNSPEFHMSVISYECPVALFVPKLLDSSITFFFSRNLQKSRILGVGEKMTDRKRHFEKNFFFFQFILFIKL